MRLEAIAGSVIAAITLSFGPAAFAEKLSAGEMDNPVYIPSAMDLESFRRSRSTLFDWFRLHLMLSKVLHHQINHLREEEKKAPPVVDAAGAANALVTGSPAAAIPSPSDSDGVLEPVPAIEEKGGVASAVTASTVVSPPEGPDGVSVPGPAAEEKESALPEPTEVEPGFSVAIFQANSGGLPSHALYAMEKRGDIYGLATSPARVNPLTHTTEYRFDSAAQAVTVRTPVPGSAQSPGVAPEMKTVTYTAAGNPAEYRAALVQMRDHAQAAYKLLQNASYLDPDGAKRAKIQSVIDAINRELQ